MQGSLVSEYFMVCCNDTLCMAKQVEFTTTNINREGECSLSRSWKHIIRPFPEGQNSYFLPMPLWEKGLSPHFPSSGDLRRAILPRFLDSDFPPMRSMQSSPVRGHVFISPHTHTHTILLFLLITTLNAGKGLPFSLLHFPLCDSRLVCPLRELSTIHSDLGSHDHPV